MVITKPNQISHTVQAQYQHYCDVNMHYQKGANNYQTGVKRLRMTTLIAVRAGIVAPVIIRWLYKISQHQALEHLNKLVKNEYLKVVKTFRSPDGRVYVPTYKAAKYAEELMGVEVYFRSNANPALQFNHNTVMHDLMNTFVMLRGIHNETTDGIHKPMWTGFITEPELRRLNKDKNLRAVDGLVQEHDGSTVAIEIEHAFKNKQTRQALLLKYLYGLKNNYFSKVFFISHSKPIFEDMKRLHDQLLEELPKRYDKKTRVPVLNDRDVDILKEGLVYRTKFTEEVAHLFYRE